MTDSSTNKVLITGTYGTRNFGDEKILKSIIGLVRKFYGEETYIYVASANPEQTEQNHDVTAAIPHIEYNFIEYIRLFKSIDKVIIGGGTVIGEPFSYRHSVLSIISRFVGNDTYLASAGTGHVSVGLDRVVLEGYLDQLDGISVRSQKTKDTLLNEYTEEPIDVVPDPGYVQQDISEVPINVSEDSLIVFGRFFDHQGVQVDTEGLAQALDLVSEETDYKITFAPMMYPDDVEFGHHVAEQMDAGATVLDQEYTIDEIEALLATAPLVVAMRLHSMIVAAAHGTDFVPISYHPKCEATLSQLGVTHWFEYDDINSQKLSNSISNYNSHQQIHIDHERVTNLQKQVDQLFTSLESQQREKSKLLRLVIALPLAILSDRIQKQ